MRLLGDKVRSLLVYQTVNGELTMAPWSGQGETLSDLKRIPVEVEEKVSVRSVQEAKTMAGKLGYPVMLKAAGGGGGRGIEACYSDEDIEKGFPKVVKEGGGSQVFVMAMATQRHQVLTLEEAMSRFQALDYPVILSFNGRSQVIKDPTELKKESPHAQEAFPTFRQAAEQFFGEVTNLRVESSDLQNIPIVIQGGGWKHEEVQVLADKYGNVVAFPPRDCSMQMRNQKRLEETSYAEFQRKKRMMEAAVKVSQAAGLRSAATVEFLTNPQTGQIEQIEIKRPEKDEATEYNLEVNTRLQVESPVTEFDIGFNIMAMQMLIGQGIPLIHPRPRSVSLELLSSRSYSAGVVRLHYSVLRKASKRATARKAVRKRKRPTRTL
jgi:biotin carboxylase